MDREYQKIPSLTNGRSGPAARAAEFRRYPAPAGDVAVEQRRVDGIETYGFPSDLLGHPLLTWMGADYLRFVMAELLQRFRQQDPGTEMLAVKCEAPPRLSTEAGQHTGTVRGVKAEFDLQVLLRASSGRRWRLRGIGNFGAADLDQPAGTSVSVGFNLRSAEEVV
jgi:hypothetical protein